MVHRHAPFHETESETVDEIGRFFETHRMKLLKYLDGIAPRAAVDPNAFQYVQDVLAEWVRISADRSLKAACRRERTFWFALYQLEELNESPVRNWIDPYEAILLQNLAHVRELLRNWGELPDRFYATRPGEVFELTS